MDVNNEICGRAFPKVGFFLSKHLKLFLLIVVCGFFVVGKFFFSVVNINIEFSGLERKHRKGGCH